MRRSSFQKIDGAESIDVSLSREIDSKYDEIRIVADNIDDVTAVAGLIGSDAFQTNADNAAAIGTVAASIGSVNEVALSMDAVEVVAADLMEPVSEIETVANSIANVDNVGINIVDVNTVAGGIVDVSSVAANIANIGVVASDIVPNLTEILQADDNAATATVKASEASGSAELAEKWATEAEDVPVVGSVGVDGEYSAYHWAKKAEAAAGGNIALDSLYDVDTTGVLDKQVLRYDPAGTADKKWIPTTLDKAYVGLANVDNTADVVKVVASASKLTTAKTITVDGDVSGTTAFDGSSDVTVATTLVNVGTEGTYTKVTTDAKGRVTAGSNPTTLSGYGIADAYTKIQVDTALNAKVDESREGVANGVATLDSNSKVPLAQIPDSILGQLEYQGVWNMATYPTATQRGQYWVANGAGNGYAVGDWAVWNGSSFDKVDNTDAVSSVAGRTGAVVLTKADVGLSNVDNTGDASKVVASAAKLTTARTLSLTGDAYGSMSFDGSGNASSALTLATSGVTAGTYNIVTVDAKGRVTAGANLVFGTASTFDVHTARNNEPNKVVRTDGSGYLHVGYINSSNGNENNVYGLGRIWGTNGSDDYLRTYQPEGVSVGYAKFQESRVAGNSCAEVFYNTPAGTTSTRECSGWGDAPNFGWWIIKSLRHTNGNGYWGTQIAYGWENNANKIYQRNVSNNTWTSWYNQGLNSTGNPPNYACRAWVNFNGTGTVAIRASGNVSSITDNGVGDYTVNFTTAMPDANYSMSGGTQAMVIGGSSEGVSFKDGIAILAGSSRILTHRTGVGNIDTTYATVTYFR